MQIQKAYEYIVGYTLLVFSCALGVATGFGPLRAVLSALTELMGGVAAAGDVVGPFQASLRRNAADRFVVAMLGVLSIILIVVVEHAYRTGVERRRLSYRFLLVTVIEVSTLFVVLLFQAVLAAVLDRFTIWNLLLPLAALIVAAALSWPLARLKKRPSAS